MKKIISQRLKTMIFIFLLIISPAILYAVDANQLFQHGYSAYQNDLYLDAVKYLFAYQLVATGASPDFYAKVQAALNYSEDQVIAAIRTKEELDRYGKVTVVESKGKADDVSGSSATKTVPFNSYSVEGSKPVLPSLLKKMPLQMKEIKPPVMR